MAWRDIAFLGFIGAVSGGGALCVERMGGIGPWLARRGTRAGLIAGTLGVCLSAAAPAPAMTLEEALTQLIDSHPAIRLDEEKLNSANQRLRGAASGFLPRVSLTGDYGAERIDSPARRNVPPNDPSQAMRESVTLSVTQTLYDGANRDFNLRGAEYDREAQEFTLETTRQNILFEGVQAFVEVLRQSELMELVRVNEAAAERQFGLEQQRLTSGQGVAIDLLLARSRLQLAKERRVVFNGNLQNSYSRFRQVYGTPANPEDLVVPQLPLALLPTSLDTSTRTARVMNPLISSTTSQVDATRARQQAAQSQVLPRLDLVGSTGYREGASAEPGTRREASVLLRATWDLFTGFAVQANAAAAAFDHAAAINQLHVINRRVEEEVRNTWQNLQTQCERRFLLENALGISLEVLESRRTLAAAGRETALRVLDAETEVTNAQINLAATVFDEMIASYRMLLVTGQLDPPVLQRAGAAQRREGALPTLVEWCRQHASLELRRDDPFRVPGAPTSPDINRDVLRDGEARRDSNPFAAPGDDTESEDGDPFASPPEQTRNGLPFEDPDAPAPSLPASPLPPVTTLPGVNAPPGTFEPGDEEELDPFDRRGQQPLPAPLQPQPRPRADNFQTDDAISASRSRPVTTAATGAAPPVAPPAATARAAPAQGSGGFDFDDDIQGGNRR